MYVIQQVLVGEGRGLGRQSNKEKARSRNAEEKGEAITRTIVDIF